MTVTGQKVFDIRKAIARQSHNVFAYHLGHCASGIGGKQLCTQATTLAQLYQLRVD